MGARGYALDVVHGVLIYISESTQILRVHPDHNIIHLVKALEMVTQAPLN